MLLSPKPRAGLSSNIGMLFTSAQQLLQLIWGQRAEWFAAVSSALFIGLLVAAVNLPHGWPAAASAGCKQALWTGLMAGLLTRLCRYLCCQSQFRLVPPMVWATLCPSLVAVAGASLLHNLRGTAEPLASIMITVALAPPGFWLAAYNLRRYNH